jgi:hypothetical protein
MPEDPDPIPDGTLGTVIQIHEHIDWVQVEVAWELYLFGEFSAFISSSCS